MNLYHFLISKSIISKPIIHVGHSDNDENKFSFELYVDRNMYVSKKLKFKNVNLSLLCSMRVKKILKIKSINTNLAKKLSEVSDCPTNNLKTDKRYLYPG